MDYSWQASRPSLAASHAMKAPIVFLCLHAYFAPLTNSPNERINIERTETLMQ